MEIPIHPLKLPLCQADYQQAIAQASTATDPAIAQQIKYGMLAALSARYYLRLLGVASELLSESFGESLERSLERQPAIAPTQALQISPALALRCIPVIVGQPLNHHHLYQASYPESSNSDCLGTLAIQIDLARRESELLGFVPTECLGEKPLAEKPPTEKPPTEKQVFPALQPLAALISRLSDISITHLQQWLVGKVESSWRQISQSQISQSQISQSQILPSRAHSAHRSPAGTACFRSAPSPVPATPPTEASLLEIIHYSPDDEQRWQAAEQLWQLNPSHPASPILRAKDLGLYLDGHTVTLLVGILTKPNQDRLILVRLLPLGENPYLPDKLALTGLTEAGDTVFSIQSRSQDDFIQFKFTAAAGDRFTLDVRRGAACVTEHFIV